MEGWAFPPAACSAAGLALSTSLQRHSTARTPDTVGAGAVVISAVVAASRVYLGVHWLTDVLGGAALSVAVLATWSVLRLVWRRAERPAG